jgi:uncharacterized protein (DUF2062 family)
MSAALLARNVCRKLSAPVTKRLQAVLTCGLTPQKCALTLCLGSAIGLLPILWGTTLLCVLLAYLFRLNQVALQAVNYLLYPLQLALLLPFFKLGTWLIPWGPPIPSNVLATLVHNPGLSSLNFLVWIMFKSLAAWSVIVIPVALLAYGILRATAFRETDSKQLHDHNV